MAKQMKRKFEPAFENLPIDKIIGAPLQATASANGMMAREQVQFIMDFCFKKDGDNYQPVMIEMVMSRSQLVPDERGGSPKLRRFNTRFNLPLLTIIPISSLSVETFEIDFDMEITSLEAQETRQDLKSPGEGSDGNQELKLMGKVSNKQEQMSRNSQYQKKIDSKLSINIKGGPLPLPVGLTSILDLYTKNIEPIDISEEHDSDELLKD